MTSIIHTNDTEGEKLDDMPSCCTSNHENDSDQIQNPLVFKNYNQVLIILLIIALVTNIAVMAFFTFTVNRQLNTVIDVTKPQEGDLTLVLPRNCQMCGDFSELTAFIKNQNVEIKSEKAFYADTTEGQKIISDYGLEKLPALIFASPDSINSKLAKLIEKDSRSKEDNTLIWEQTLPPYLDVETESVVGLVEVTFLTDNSCSTCYNVVNTQGPILQRFGLAIGVKNTVDVSEAEGKRLLEKYNIIAVPTIILSSEANIYDALVKVWNQVGTIENDGNFVFREMDALPATYRDLKTGKIIEAEVD